jgi:hypothetical protein
MPILGLEMMVKILYWEIRLFVCIRWSGDCCTISLAAGADDG